MTTQPESLRLADVLGGWGTTTQDQFQAAAELRRLHAENNECRSALRNSLEDDEALMRQALESLELAVSRFSPGAYEQVMSQPDFFVNKTLFALRERLGNKT